MSARARAKATARAARAPRASRCGRAAAAAAPGRRAGRAAAGAEAGPAGAARRFAPPSPGSCAGSSTCRIAHQTSQQSASSGTLSATNRKNIVHSIAGGCYPRSARAQARGSEAADRLELGHARVDLGALELVEPLGAEALDVERGACGAVGHRAAQRRVVRVAALAPRGSPSGRRRTCRRRRSARRCRSSGTRSARSSRRA